jgi:hypothetical protein
MESTASVNLLTPDLETSLLTDILAEIQTQIQLSAEGLYLVLELYKNAFNSKMQVCITSITVVRIQGLQFHYDRG